MMKFPNTKIKAPSLPKTTETQDNAKKQKSQSQSVFGDVSESESSDADSSEQDQAGDDRLSLATVGHAEQKKKTGSDGSTQVHQIPTDARPGIMTTLRTHLSYDEQLIVMKPILEICVLTSRILTDDLDEISVDTFDSAIQYVQTLNEAGPYDTKSSTIEKWGIGLPDILTEYFLAYNMLLDDNPAKVSQLLLFIDGICHALVARKRMFEYKARIT
jgi:hypothetical protein